MFFSQHNEDIHRGVSPACPDMEMLGVLEVSISYEQKMSSQRRTYQKQHHLWTVKSYMVMKCLSNNNNKAFKVPKFWDRLWILDRLVSIGHIYGKRKAYVFPNQIQRRNYKLGHQFQISISMKTIYALMLTLNTSN